MNTILHFALFSGARIGECLGLTWECVDFQNNTVTIVNNLCFAYGKWFISSTKTKSGTRTIKMSQYIMDLLRLHNQHQDEAKKVVGRAWAQPRVVFTSPTGNFYDRTYVNNDIPRSSIKYPTIYTILHGIHGTKRQIDKFKR